MNYVNLLPDEMVRGDQERRSWRVKACVASIAVVVAVAWSGIAVVQMQAVNSQIRLKEELLRPKRLEAARLERYARDEAELADRLDTVSKLRDGVAPAFVTAYLSRVIPENMVVRSLTTERAPVPLKLDHQRQHGDLSARTTRIYLEGWVPTSVSIAELVADLRRCSIVTNVRLEDSRDTMVDQQPVHALRVFLEVAPREPAPGATALAGETP